MGGDGEEEGGGGEEREGRGIDLSRGTFRISFFCESDVINGFKTNVNNFYRNSCPLFNTKKRDSSTTLHHSHSVLCPLRDDSFSLLTPTKKTPRSRTDEFPNFLHPSRSSIVHFISFNR